MEPPVKKLQADTSVNKQQTDFAEVQKQQVTNILTYDVLRVIFKYLGAKDLYKAAEVCRSWREAASNEAATRCVSEQVLKKFQITGGEDSDDAYCSTLVGNELKVKPTVGLIFEKVQEENEWTPKGCYCKNLPQNCSALILGGYDIVADNTVIDNSLGMAICTFLPQIPKLNFKVLYVDRYTFKGVSDIDINAHAEKLLKQLLPSKNEKSKCIIMLAAQSGYQFTKRMLKGLQKSYKPGSISLWGGVCVDLRFCQATKTSHKCSNSARWLALSLSSPSLQTWSIILLRSCRSEAQIKEKLENWKNSISLKKHSLGLMYACCERLNKKEIEASVFKTIFPQVPLVGLHGDGEYGLNTLSTKRESPLDHSYSTVFLILTYQ